MQATQNQLRRNAATRQNTHNILTKDVFVLELKVDDTVDNALRQIDDKSYAIQWSADGRRVTKCGVRIDSERRNITDWKLVDEKNETIEEKNF